MSHSAENGACRVGCGHPPADHDENGECMHLCDCAWPQTAEKDARCNVCGQSLDTFPCPVSWDSEHRPRHDETRPIPPGVDQ